jgi:hypothetical protein
MLELALAPFGRERRKLARSVFGIFPAFALSFAFARAAVAPSARRHARNLKGWPIQAPFISLTLSSSRPPACRPGAARGASLQAGTGGRYER